MKKGFTLIETLVYTAIVGLVIVALAQFVFTIATSRNKNYVTEEVQANARNAMNVLSQKIRSAVGVNTSASIFEAHPGLLSLAMADPAVDPTIFTVTAAGVLTMQEGAGDALPLTSDEVRVTDLIFSNLTGNSLRENIGIFLTVEFAGDTQDFSSRQHLESSVGVRQ